MKPWFSASTALSRSSCFPAHIRMPSIRRSRLIVFRFAAAGPVRWKKGSSSSGTAAPFFDGPPFSAFAALPLGGLAAAFGGAAATADAAAASSPPSSLALDARSPDARSAFAASRSAFRAAAASFFSSFVSFFSKSFSSPLCSPPPMPMPAFSMRCRSSSVISASSSARFAAAIFLASFLPSLDMVQLSELFVYVGVERWPKSRRAHAVMIDLRSADSLHSCISHLCT